MVRSECSMACLALGKAERPPPPPSCVYFFSLISFRVFFLIRCVVVVVVVVSAPFHYTHGADDAADDRKPNENQNQASSISFYGYSRKWRLSLFFFFWIWSGFTRYYRVFTEFFLLIFVVFFSNKAVDVHHQDRQSRSEKYRKKNNINKKKMAGRGLMTAFRLIGFGRRWWMEPFDWKPSTIVQPLASEWPPKIESVSG